jgi:hypothetical protein
VDAAAGLIVTVTGCLAPECQCYTDGIMTVDPALHTLLATVGMQCGVACHDHATCYLACVEQAAGYRWAAITTEIGCSELILLC